MFALLKKILSLLPPSFSRWIYTKLCKPKLFRLLADTLIISIIPKSVRITEGALMLDQTDAAVSGQLALEAYEKFETELFRKHLKNGMTVVDIGANIGYYTVIAAARTGEKGKVFSFEPEPNNHSRLKDNIKVNNFKNVFASKFALSDKQGEHRLFLTESNKGAHSLADQRHTGNYITIETTTLDQFLNNHGSPKVDLIKMDIEGAEPLALKGMSKTIAASQNLTIFTELYPKGMLRLGIQPIEFLKELTRLGFRISCIDINKKTLTPLPERDFEKFLKSFSTRGEPTKDLYATKVNHPVTQKVLP